jgi:hypothetical protein
VNLCYKTLFPKTGTALNTVRIDDVLMNASEFFLMKILFVKRHAVGSPGVPGGFSPT